MPTARTRSSSRSRVSVDKKMKSPEPAPAPRSRSRGRQSAKKEKAEVRKASKSATPKKTPTTRQRSSSRGRPSTKKIVKIEKKSPKTEKIESTTEVADDDDDEVVVVKSPRLRARALRNLTQDQPTQRPKTPISPSSARTFSEVSQVPLLPGPRRSFKASVLALLTLIFVTPIRTVLHIWIEFWTTRNSADKKKTLFLIAFATFLAILYVASRVDPEGVQRMSSRLQRHVAPVYDVVRGSVWRSFDFFCQKLHKLIGPTMSRWGVGPA